MINFIVLCILIVSFLILHELVLIRTALVENNGRSYKQIIESIKTPKPERVHKEREIRRVTSRDNKITTPVGIRNQVQDELLSLDRMPMEDLFNSIDDNGRLKEG